MKTTACAGVMWPPIVVWALWILLVPAGCMNLEKGVMCKKVETKKAVGLENMHMRLEFSRETGSLISLKNSATGDEYLKDPGGDGNPFRAYVDTTEMPPILRINFPFPVQPVEGPWEAGSSIPGTANWSSTPSTARMARPCCGSSRTTRRPA